MLNKIASLFDFDFFLIFWAKVKSVNHSKETHTSVKKKEKKHSTCRQNNIQSAVFQINQPCTKIKQISIVIGETHLQFTLQY